MDNRLFLLPVLIKILKTGISAVGLVCVINWSVYAQMDHKSYGQMALQESIVPVRPGIPGKIAFWNGFSRRFIYAPAFDYKIIDEAHKYRFEIISWVDSSKYSFESRVPYAALSPVWASVPIGFFKLTVTGISSNGQNIGISGQGEYYRAAYFDGIYHEPVMRYDQSARIALDNLLNKDYVNYWFTNNKPDPTYGYYRYPAKIMGALIVGAVTQARLKSNGQDVERYTTLARIIADYLISISFEKGTPLEYFPPTYKGYKAIFKKTPHIQTDNALIISAAEGGNAYLDLYDLTSDKKYLEAAKRIAETYVKTQLDNGSWFMFVNVNTGKQAAPNIAIPTAVINYFDRLSRDYDVSGLEDATQKALKWIMENPMVTYDWQGQFEDISARRPYNNQSREQVCDMAVYLLNHSKSNPQNLSLAEDLIRFAEDQFVIWDKPAIKKKKKKRKGPAWEPQNWITPSVQEQYTFFEPVGRTACIMMETYRQAYQVTKKDIYLAKAISIANTFTVVQNEHIGDYPTLFSKYKSNFWLNSVVYPAKMMMILEDNLDELNK